MLCYVGGRYFKGPVTFRVRRRILKSREIHLNSSTVSSSITGEFCFANLYFRCIIFKINEALILNANLANVKQLFGTETLSGLSRNRPQASNVNAKLDHGPVVGKMDNNIHWMNLYTVVNTIGRLDYQPLFGKMSPHSSRPDPGDGGNRAYTIGFHNTYPVENDLSGPSCSKGGQHYPPDKSLSSGWFNCLS